MLSQNGFNYQQKYDRLEVANNVIEFKHKSKKYCSERMAAQDMSIPRTTLREQSSKSNQIPLPGKEIDFFTSPEGINFLHKLLVALQFVMTEVGDCGIRLVSMILELTSLHYFVASSKSHLQKRGVELEKHIIEYGDNQIAQLSKTMPQKLVTVAQDETFHPKICLVAMEPVSNYILLEQYSDKRDATSWSCAMKEVTNTYTNMNIIQSTSDEAAGLLNHVKSSLLSHHSPDLFHVQYAVSKATSAAMSSKVRNATKAVEELQNKKTVNDEKLSEAKKDLELKSGLSEIITNAKKDIGRSYHPFDLTTGSKVDTKTLEDKLTKNITSIEDAASKSNLSDKSFELIQKAKNVFPKMTSTISFFWNHVDNYLTSQVVDVDIKQLLTTVLIPLLYLKIVLTKSQSKELRSTINNTISVLFNKLSSNIYWQLLSDNDKDRLEQFAKNCANIFQRSSSCVEGRNGYLSLRQHSLHNISDRKLKVLTVVHNFFIKRLDNTTAAERFFEQKPPDLFNYLVEHMPKPGWPRVLKKQEGLSMVA